MPYQLPPTTHSQPDGHATAWSQNIHYHESNVCAFIAVKLLTVL